MWVLDRLAEHLGAVDGVVDPYRVGEYPNFVEHPAEPSRFFEPNTWNRLREVKAQHDPDALFRGNHYIPPATVPAVEAG